MNPLFVGIDVSSRNNVAYLMNPDGSKHSSFSVQNNLGGAKLLSERIVSALSSMQLEHVVIGLEATSIYGDSLVYALREDGRLGRFQRKIHVLNPKQVKKFKEAYPDLPKNDFVDAFVIADHLRFGRIARAVYMDDYPLTSIPGIGKVYSAGIIAEIGDIHRFDSQASIAKFAGLVWTQHQSGDFEAEHSQMIKTGNRYLRYYLLEAANSVRRCDSEFRRYYDLKFKEVNRFQHKRALALTARKLVRLVFRLLKDNRLYIPPEG